ncbi:MAG: SlyX family protein [Pseudomonadota bacterium]
MSTESENGENEDHGDSETCSRKLENVQSELAFQGDTLESLDRSLASQQADILFLKQQVQILGAELKRVKEGFASTDSHSPEVPPHF